MARKRNNQREFNCLRAVEFRPIETRAADDGESDGSQLYGYAAVFDVDTLINSWEGTFYERMQKGSFRKTLKERTPVCQFDHGYDQRTGTVPIGVFTILEERDEGLYVEADLFDNDVVLPIRQAIARKAITGMSFRFQVVRDEWRDADGKKIKPEDLWEALWKASEDAPLSRTIKEVKLSEAGPVVFPAYTATSVGVRSDVPDDIASLPEEERRKIVAESYARTASRHSPTEHTDAESSELTSVTPSEDAESIEDITATSPESEGTTTDAVREDTSTGHEEVAKRVIPQRIVRARRIPTRIERK